ncbi:FAD-dependent oxidoreductase, partial [Candidatus Gottesmanbacteria bacterium]|nr:FAD-dependent oxidoreductase [Candidatus Gottesmanbacteria bacterium]
IQHELDLVTKLRDEKYEKVLSQLENVSYIDGRVAFVSANEIEVNGPAFAKATAGKQKYTAKKFIIAAGSTATVPPIENIKEVGYITHIEALKLKQQPKELIVVGAGPLGLEFAQMYARFGTKVTILHRGSSIFRGEEELITRLTEILINEGIIIRTGVKVQSVRKEGDKKIVSYTFDGKTEEVSGDEILLAVGKTPNTQGLELGKAGVEIDEKQAIKVNKNFQTSQPHIFAVGDVINLALRQEPIAGREGTLATENALKDTQNSIDYNSVPWTIFTDPQLAGVGFTEEEQMKHFGTCMCKTVSFKDVPKALIINRTEGLIKMAIHPDTKQIMGVHILAPNAGELIAEAMMLVKNKNTTDDVINSLPMFPTLSESIKIAALSFTNDITKLSCCV